MKKNRNTFFQESQTSFNMPNPMMSQYQMMANNQMYYPNGLNNDIEEKLAKIERQINRLDKRITDLENNTIKSTDDFESTTNNMYMI